ncbi:hypothetical protein G6048_39060 [Streptomyces sp. YC419]|uniref:Uncharacterized protein n=1 Tax=Streptomyces ureilyticus TaxID=1775131 RepID=A0ABX0E0V2_9ACTN|nr:hypothetical protein [Streptomyces ureilyticus]
MTDDLDSELIPQREGVYVSSYDPDPLTKRAFISSPNTDLLTQLKRHLGEAVVRYERQEPIRAPNLAVSVGR